MDQADVRQDALMQDLLEQFTLTEKQLEAVAERRRDVAVTAGAGSGKTRTLVARYLPLLAECGSPRAVAAITFTDKAAREMRSRIRKEVRRLAGQDQSAAVEFWRQMEPQLDAARISTIHSLCQEILRSQPVEARLDPQFDVADETQAALLRVQAVRDVLNEAVEREEFQPLFRLFRVSTLESLLNQLALRRLDVEQLLEVDCGKAACGRLRAWRDTAEVAGAVKDLCRWQQDGTLAAEARGGNAAAEMALGLAADFAAFDACLLAGEAAGANAALFEARKNRMALNKGKKGPVKECLAQLRHALDGGLPWLAKGDAPLAAGEESAVAQAVALLLVLFERCEERYIRLLRRKNLVDFDDLEGKAKDLLADPDVARRWQGEISALLVDEFQDTNARQRAIVEALWGRIPGRLFVVGDARQSIYRFRGADVTVFRALQADIRRRDGLLVDLDLTFRSHQELLECLNGLLPAVMGVDEDPERPYRVAFTPLVSKHPRPRSGCRAPHFEFSLGMGASAAEGRERAAAALCQRLVELKTEGQIARWDDVTLLFRASTGFPAYENAFEAAGIPYLTVAGQGFYDRPEIRDVLNLLRALAFPWDDLALAGLLRSPVFGLSLEGLALLRGPRDQRRPLYQALLSDSEGLSAEDREVIGRAREYFGRLEPLVDRIPVADLLARVVAFTDYRAVLAGNSSRLWRNLDKLVADAHASRMVQVRAFLEYLQSTKDVGAREGEAPAEAEGAVRLMTVHKSKGLEFEVVVLADAGRRPRGGSESFYLQADYGLTCKPDRYEAAPLAFRLAQADDSQRAEAEEARLLYVALTRAKEKVIISGHLVKNKKGSVSAPGYLGQLLAAAGIAAGEAAAAPGERATRVLQNGAKIGLWVCPTTALVERQPAADLEPISADDQDRPLYEPLAVPPKEAADEQEEIVWTASGAGALDTGAALGKMVHAALQRWVFPGDKRLANLLQTAALDAGLLDGPRRARALQQAETLLGRLKEHPLWQEVQSAGERAHEAPYTWVRADGRPEQGCIDLLYRVGEQWRVVDFKTDAIENEDDLQRLAARYRPQLQRYSQACCGLLGQVEHANLCFLDDRGKVTLLRVS